MPLWVRGAFERFGILMQDENAVRWPYHPHRVRYFNDALKAIALHKPSACTSTQILTLVSGSRQAIPEAANQLVKVVRNVLNADNTEVIGRTSVTTVSRADMDASVPDWSDPAVFPVQKRVKHVMYDEEADPRHFYVWPPNAGTGRVEAVLAVRPADIATPAVPDSLESYSVYAEEVDAIYMTAIVHWMASMAYAMDAQFPDAAARSAAHFQAFANELGVKMTNEMRLSPNRPAARPETPLG